MSLFEQTERINIESAQPLAARMRPRTLNEFVGQLHFLGPGKLLRQLVEADRLGSVIFYGPPGTGKTTLARILAGETKREFAQLSAIMHGVKELREVLQSARDTLAAEGRGTLLFIDEIHRFNRAQQDAMLDDVENGVVTLIGATTSNPFFAVNGALVSRSQVFQFEPLDRNEIEIVVHRALSDADRGLGGHDIRIEREAVDYLANTCDGDARKVLSILETAVISFEEKEAPKIVTLSDVKNASGTRAFQYDASGDEHYDCASALIKSIRGSDPDAGLYWLARMLEGGEDVRFLCRRLIILASEDVGNADPHALPLAVACSQACEQIGLPECQLVLSQTVTYLACARNRTRPPSRSVPRGGTFEKNASCQCPSTCATVIIERPRNLAAALDTSIHTTKPMEWPARITWVSIVSITSPSIEGLRLNWADVCCSHSQEAGFVKAVGLVR